eukprot:5435873-Amphidinium_carterae.1
MSSPVHFWWSCVAEKCNGWEWGTRLQCRKCKAYAPKWVAEKATKACADRDGMRSNADRTSDRGRANSKAKRKQARAKSRARSARAADRTDGEGEHTSAEAISDEAEHRRNLLQRIKRMEGLQKQFGAEMPAELADSIQGALEEARQEMHDKEPAGKRLQALQQGVERKMDRLQKLETKLDGVAAQREALEPQLMQELEKVRLQYRAKHVQLEAEANQLMQQKEALEEALAELRDRLREL